MAATAVNAPGVRAGGNYSHAVVSEGPTRTLYMSGQVALAEDGSVPDGFEAQARLVFRNIAAHLAAAGMGVGHIVKMTTFLVRRDDTAAFRAIREEVLGGHRPASTLVFAELIDPRWLLEVEVIAAD